MHWEMFENHVLFTHRDTAIFLFCCLRHLPLSDHRTCSRIDGLLNFGALLILVQAYVHLLFYSHSHYVQCRMHVNNEHAPSYKIHDAVIFQSGHFPGHISGA